MSFSKQIQKVPISTLCQFLEAVRLHRGESQSRLERYTGLSASTARRAVAVLEALSLITPIENGWECCAPEVQRGITDEDARLLVKRAILAARPFEAVCEGLAMGEPYAEARRKAAAILDIDERLAGNLDVLKALAIDVGILEQLPHGEVQLAREFAPNVEALLLPDEEAIDSAATARLAVAKAVGREAYNYLDETDRELLADALLNCGKNNQLAADCAGKAVEDFLRHVATDKGLAAEASRCNGASQLANMMAGRNVIHSNQQKLVDAAGTLRNAGAHKKDKKTLSPWIISELGSRASVANALCSIRSIYGFVCNGDQQL